MDYLLLGLSCGLGPVVGAWAWLPGVLKRGESQGTRVKRSVRGHTGRGSAEAVGAWAWDIFVFIAAEIANGTLRSAKDIGTHLSGRGGTVVAWAWDIFEIRWVCGAVCSA